MRSLSHSTDSCRPGLKVSAAVAALCALVPCVIVPMQTWLGNSTALGFGAAPLLAELALLWIVVAILLWGLVWFGGKCLGRLPLVLVLAGAFYAYLETGVLTAGAPPLDGETAFWERPDRIAIDTAVLVAVVAAAISLRRFLARHAVLVAGAVAVLSAASLADVKRETIRTVDSLGDNPFAAGVVERDLVANSAFFSTNRNVIVFILDAMTDEVIHDVLSHEPAIAASFGGFRVFRDNVGMYPSTPYGVASLMTGRRYDGTLTVGEYLETPFSEASVLWPYLQADVPMFVQLGSFKRFGFTNRCVETRESRAANVPCVFRHIEGEQEWSVAQLAVFRLSPFLVKKTALQFFMWRWSLVKSRIRRSTDNEPSLYRKLGKSGVRPDVPLTFHVYHTRGCHVPFTVDRNGAKVPPMPGYKGACEKTCFVLKQLAALFDRLRAVGVYDRSLIVITADHGNTRPGRAVVRGVDMKKEVFFNRAFPCLAVKAAGASGPLRDVDIPTSHGNISRLLEAALAGEPGEGEIDAILRDDGERVFTDNFTPREDDVWLDWVFKTDGTVERRTYNPRRDPSSLPVISLGKTMSFKQLARSLGNGLPPVVFTGFMDGRVQGPSFSRGHASLSMKVADPGALYDVELGLEVVLGKGADESLSAGEGEGRQTIPLTSRGKREIQITQLRGVRDSISISGLRPAADGVLTVPLEKTGTKSTVFVVSIRVNKGN